MTTIEKGDFLDPARVDLASFEHRVIRIADTRIDVSLGKCFEEVRDDELSSSEVDEPVCDDSDFFVWMIHSIF